MSTLTKTVAFVLLAVWGLATWHCDLEQVPGLDFLACCQHPDTAPHTDDDCNQDGCAVVESGHYRMEEKAASAPAPLILLSWVLPLWEQPAPSAPPVLELSSAPPELPHIWQFSSRAALPPRAPSFVS